MLRQGIEKLIESEAISLEDYQLMVCVMSRPSDACVWACPVVHVWAARAHLSLSGLTPVCRQRHRATYRAPRRALLEPHPLPRTITTLAIPLPGSQHPAYQLRSLFLCLSS